MQLYRNSSGRGIEQDGLHAQRTTLQATRALYTERRRLYQLRYLKRIHSSHNHREDKARRNLRTGDANDARVQTKGRPEERSERLAARLSQNYLLRTQHNQLDDSTRDLDPRGSCRDCGYSSRCSMV